MPCCCASNIKAAFFIGIYFAICDSLSIYMSFRSGDTFKIIIGVLCLANASILTYGAHTCNSKAMLIYMVSTILLLINFIVQAAVGILEGFLVFNNKDTISKLKTEACEEFRGTKNYQDCLKTGDQVLKVGGAAGLVFIIVIAVGVIIFDIWTIIVAKNAQKEIEAEQFTPVEILGPMSIISTGKSK